MPERRYAWELNILKPVNEEELERQLLETVQKLEEQDKKKLQYIDEKTQWMHFLNGKAEKEEYGKYEKLLNLTSGYESYYTAVMKWNAEGLKEKKITEVLVELKKDNRLKIVHLPPDNLLMVIADAKTDENGILEYFLELQNRIESRFDIMTYKAVGSSYHTNEQKPESYKSAKKLQKYLIIEGYGSCIGQKQIGERKAEAIHMDEALLRKYILKKEKDHAADYIEDLFISNIRKDASVSSLYQTAVKLAVLFQDIKKEYKLESDRFYDLTELIETIFSADDILGIKAAFVSEITEIMECMHEENTQYTPVVRQIIAEVQNNYKEDMNLKTLAYKYHMNASYLGQIFQKEAGCSFAQYLSNTKNGIAKDLILNTNMKINDIAKEVGYPDSSYFYRKFKQCYGVSPASLREMKKY